MPDHAHFFCAPGPAAKSIESFIGKWKEWAAKYLHRRVGVSVPVWQEEFFDRVLRSEESYSEKLEYMWQNPVRGGLVKDGKEWPYKGCATDDWLVNELKPF